MGERLRACPDCDGKGQIEWGGLYDDAQLSICHRCRGTGKVLVKEGETKE